MKSTKINYVSEVSFHIIWCKINVRLMIHVTKNLFTNMYKYWTFKYSVIIICVMIVITIPRNTMNVFTEQSIIPQGQKLGSSHIQQFIRYYTNFILCYCNYHTHTGSPCINKHFRSTECTTIKLVTYLVSCLGPSRA